MTFITSHGIYYYIAMTFGLKNASATYQKCKESDARSLRGEGVN
jgi:hypothetical protein